MTKITDGMSSLASSESCDHSRLLQTSRKDSNDSAAEFIKVLHKFPDTIKTITHEIEDKHNSSEE